MTRFRHCFLTLTPLLALLTYAHATQGQPKPTAKTPVITTIPQPGAAPKTDKPASPEQMGITASETVRLSTHPEASQILSEVANAFEGVSIDVGLLSGQKYEAGDCLGLKVSSGTFSMQMTKPQFAVDNTGIVFSFTIPHVTMNALKLHTKPSADFNPCSYGGLVTVGGTASDVRFIYKLDPILSIANCQLFGLHPVLDEAQWSIGGLNLKPLQNDLDKLAKAMLVASLNMISGNSMGMQFSKRLNDTLKLHPKCVG